MIVLAGMIAADEDALACDFMETYGIMDFRAIPASKAAVLAAGLRTDSRIKKLLIGEQKEENTLLLAGVADALNTLVWFKTEDGYKNVNRPLSILKTILGIEEPESDIIGFDSAEEFEKERKRIIGG